MHSTRRTFLKTGLAMAAAPLAFRQPAMASSPLQAAWVGWGDAQVLPVVDTAKAMAAGVDVALETIPVSQYFQSLEVRLAPRSGTPDFFLVDGPLTASYAARGHLLDLTSVIDQSRFAKPAVDQATYHGKLYTAPFGTSSQLLYYNRDLLERSGIEVPSADVEKRWTWEALVEAARKVNDPSKGVWGFSFEQADRPYQLFPLMQSLGAKTVSTDGLQVSGYIDCPESIEAYTFYQRLFQDWKISPAGLYDGPLVQELFGSGNLGFMVGGTYIMDSLTKRYPGVTWGVAPHPYFAGGNPVTPTGSWHIGLNARSNNIDAAQTLLAAVLSEKVMDVWFRVRPNPPVLNRLWDTTKAPFTSEGWKIIRYELDHTAMVRPATPGYAEYEDIFKLALRDIQGGSPVPDVLASAAKKIDAAIAKYRI